MNQPDYFCHQTIGFAQATVGYNRDERAAGETNYSFRKILAFAVNGITSFSYLPLRVTAVMGMIVSAMAMLLSVWVFYIRFAGKAPFISGNCPEKSVFTVF